MKISQENGYTVIDLDGDITFIRNSPAIEIIGKVENVEIKNGAYIGITGNKFQQLWKIIKLIWRNKV